jgi:hypothetical protein
MRTWTLILGPLAAWAVHFFGLYLAAEFAPALLDAGVPLLLVAGLAANGALILAASASAAWIKVIATGGGVMSSLDMAWQSLPHVIG